MFKLPPDAAETLARPWSVRWDFREIPMDNPGRTRGGHRVCDRCADLNDCVRVGREASDLERPLLDEEVIAGDEDVFGVANRNDVACLGRVRQPIPVAVRFDHALLLW